MSQIIQGDSLEELRKLADNSIDVVVTDPPYGYSFMGKNWDRAVPSIEIWKECLRVLKPGAFCLVMSAPRSDVQCTMVTRLQEAGFRLDFTPIYWTYASGFPKAANIGKLVDKRLGASREITGKDNKFGRADSGIYQFNNGSKEAKYSFDRKDKALTDEPRLLDGSYAGFQPKPAVEVIIVAMKSLSEKTYVDQALANGKGITWLDDGRIPTREISQARGAKKTSNTYGDIDVQELQGMPPATLGRFPANLLVSDSVLDGDSGSYSRFFDLDKWASTLPFLAVPKASKSEKNRGLKMLGEKQTIGGGNLSVSPATAYGSVKAPAKNHHPTVKPLKLMSYLITLFSRPGDTVLDPFVGSGTTVIAAKQLNRIGIGIEREAEYAEIALARLGPV